ncbi:MAG: Gfo/Idh/MocA family oxidoreductase [Candidatus Lokiarchaeota archaeon]|nr:Gfo/Idh/MocA family oxidoreductase [Candidatus Lokiarchaeota archaeon]
MSTNSRLKVGVIGCGIVAKNGHLPWYSKSPLAEVYAIADPDSNHLKKVSNLYHPVKQYQDPNELIDDPQIDAISICSPNWAHKDQVIRAANNGKHILCEKPLAVSLKNVDEMIRAVERNGVIFQTATQKRFDPGFQKIKEILEKGTLGEIVHVSLYWYHYIPDLDAKWIKKGLTFFKKLGIDILKELGAWRLTDPRSGGGDFLDHGPHYIDLLRWWFGELKNVSAQVRKFQAANQYEDHTAALFSFKESRTTAIFERSYNFVGRHAGKEQGRIHGLKGKLLFDVPFEPKLKPMKVYKYLYPNIITDRPTRMMIRGSKDPWNLSYARQVRSFINHVLDRSNEDVGFPKEWIPTIYDGRAALEAVMAAYESSRMQSMISFPFIPK